MSDDERKVIVILSIGEESNNIIGVASSLEKAYELLGRSTEKAPFVTQRRIQFWEIRVDQDFVPYFDAPPGKLLNPEPKKEIGKN